MCLCVVCVKAHCSQLLVRMDRRSPLRDAMRSVPWLLVAVVLVLLGITGYRLLTTRYLMFRQLPSSMLVALPPGEAM